PAWRRFPLRSRLSEHTGLPTYVDNDAKALALGEGWVGAAAGETDFVAMVVSTGVGGGIVLDGRLLDGAAGNAGHIGHVIVEPGGRARPPPASTSRPGPASCPPLWAPTVDWSGPPPWGSGASDVERRRVVVAGRGRRRGPSQAVADRAHPGPAAGRAGLVAPAS